MESNVINLKGILYPKEYSSNYIYAHYKLNDELKVLIQRSGYADKFTKDYQKALRFLENLKLICTHQKTFEKLKDADGLYSMRLIGEKNIRILFIFTEMDHRDIAVLLTCFQEKNTDDYKPQIRLALERKKELQMGK